MWVWLLAEVALTIGSRNPSLKGWEGEELEVGSAYQRCSLGYHHRLDTREEDKMEG